MNDLFAAMALVLVLEGIMPFLAPEKWREAMQQLSSMQPQSLRMMGALSMGAGLILLAVVR